VKYYLNKQIEWFAKLQQQIDACVVPRHKAILTTYLLHAGYELVGESERLFMPDMMIEEPYYRIFGLGETALREYRGKPAIKKRFYDDLNQAIVLVYDETTAVADWGLAMFATVATMMRGEQLAATGAPVDDVGATYIAEYFCAERWPFDERARLIAEEVFQIGDVKISKVAPEDVMTVEERNAAVRKFLPAKH